MERCPLADSSPLSPAAQKIAWSQCPARDGFKCVPPCPQCQKQGAAALIAAADQVVPVEFHPKVYEDCCQYSDVQTRAGIRSKLLSLAAELKQ